MNRVGYIIVGILVLAVAFFAYQQYNARRIAEIGLSNQYTKSFYELSASLNSASINLGKALVSSSSSQTAQSLAQVTRDSFSAQAYLTSMPLPLNMLLRTSKFLNQLGDYALSLARASAATPLTDNERTTLRELFDNSKSLAKQLEDIQMKAEVGRLTWNDLSKESKQDPAKPEPFKDGFQLISDEMDRVPSLTYDGPFSDHMENLTVKGLVGADISRDEAERKAEQVISQAAKTKVDMHFAEEVKGKIAAYSFASKSGTMRTDISKKGGFVLQLLNSRNVASTKISVAEAEKKAIEFIKAQNWPQLEATYPLVEDHTLLLAFVPVENGVLIYPDQIKVEVALDNGEILAQDSLSYIMNHHTRNLPPPIISALEAEAKLSKELKAIKTNLVVIPKTDATEAYCYEIEAQLKDSSEKFLVYIDALTGNEVNILYIIPSGKGTVVM